MNSLERVMTAVTGSVADHQPFTLTLSLFGARLINADIVDFYRNPSIWYNGQEEVIALFDPDILLTPFSFPLEAEAWGCELNFLPQYAPNIKKPIIADLENIDRLNIPPISHPSLQFFLQATSLLAGKYKGAKAIAAPLHSPCDLPCLLMGTELWIDTLLFRPSEAARIIEKTTAHFVAMGNQFLERGATFLVVPVNFTNPLMITNKIFMQLQPYLQKAFQQIKGPIVLHNGGCILKPFLHHFAALPNVIAIVLDPREKFNEAREILGNEIVLMGNFDGPNLSNLTQEQVKEKCLKILDDRKHDNHFIFASSNADIPYNTPLENIKVLTDTIRNFKKY